MEDLGIIILAAGKGKRMGGRRPKVLFPLGGTPLIGYVMRTAYSLNPALIAVVVGFGREHVREYVEKCADTTFRDEKGGGTPSGGGGAPRLLFAVQENQRGTGHAVQQATELFRDFTGTIMVLNGDVPFITRGTLEELLTTHRASGAGATVLTADYDDPTGYGRIIRDPSGTVVRIVEEKDATESEKSITEINSGTFAFQAEHLFRHIDRLTAGNSQRELYLTDMIAIFRENGIPVSAMRTTAPEETFGVNTPHQLEALQALLPPS